MKEINCFIVLIIYKIVNLYTTVLMCGDICALTHSIENDIRLVGP